MSEPKIQERTDVSVETTILTIKLLALVIERMTYLVFLPVAFSF